MKNKYVIYRKDFMGRKENGEYIYKEYSQALFRAQD